MKPTLTPKEFILDVDDKIEEAVSYGYPIHIDTEESLFWWMEQYADYKVDLARNNDGNLTNGVFKITWENENHLRIRTRSGRYAIIHCKYFEEMLNALIFSKPYKDEPEWNNDKNY